MSLLLINALFITHSRAQIGGDEFTWKLKKDTSGIQVFTSKVKGSKYLAVSARMTIKAKINSLRSLVMDIENCQQLSSICKKGYIQERLSQTQTYSYSYNNIPFPGRDRDVVSYVEWTTNANSGVVSMESHAVDGTARVAKVKGVIRIENALARWRFTPKGEGMVLVESFAHVDPASAMPRWLLNRLLINSPYKTMKNVRKIIEQGLYD